MGGGQGGRQQLSERETLGDRDPLCDETLGSSEPSSQLGLWPWCLPCLWPAQLSLSKNPAKSVEKGSLPLIPDHPRYLIKVLTSHPLMFKPLACRQARVQQGSPPLAACASITGLPCPLAPVPLSLGYSGLSLNSLPIGKVLTPVATVLNKVFLTILTSFRTFLW